MGRMLIAAVLALAALPARAAEDDIVLRGMGSFHVGGRIAEVSGRPAREIVRIPGGPPSKLDPNGEFMVEQMYVQYFLPKHRKGKLPLLMWHGGGLTGVTYETTPDGREGWLNLFVRKGWDVYVSDAVERGRAGFASPDVWPSEPIFLNYADPFERFRIGDGEGSWNADSAKRKVLPLYATWVRSTWAGGSSRSPASRSRRSCSHPAVCPRRWTPTANIKSSRCTCSTSCRKTAGAGCRC
jgi:hypothetical protein